MNDRGLKEWEKDYTIQTPEDILDSLGNVLLVVQAILVGIASISLLVGGIGIMNTMYTAVLERTKEIGIIRSLGGRKKDVSRVFNAESVIIGAFAGLLGVTITFLLTFPINFIAANFEESLGGVAKVNPVHLIILVIISTVLTLIGGFIPATIAAKKNPVEALRVE